MADTRDEGASIFRQSALSRITSADDLDKYIRVTNPSAWVVLFASILLIGGLAIWSATAIIPTTVQVPGVVMGTDVICWVDEVTLKLPHTLEGIGENTRPVPVSITVSETRPLSLVLGKR